MARVAQRSSTSVVKQDASGDDPTKQEFCPICRQSKYMNSSLRLLINPECYHKMCESCVDRIFGHGPAQCPMKGCNKTLRKNRFRRQTFEDIKVEREVDIRKRVSAVFNRREDEFEDIRAYNDYLNEVEDITFNMIEGIDLEDTEKRFREYEKMHALEIQENATLAQQERMEYSELQKLEREQARLRREAARREEAEEKKEVEAERRDRLRRLENGGDPEKIAKEGQGLALKKRMNRQAAEQRAHQLQAADIGTRNGSSNIVIKGLKAKVKAEPEAPVDPFGGLRLETKYFALQDDYVWEGLQQAKTDVLHGAGGYDLQAFTSRALCEAFSGLGVMIADEATEREKLREEDAVPTVRAEIAAKDVKMEDPF